MTGTTCAGHVGADGAAVPCGSPGLPVQSGGRCVRCWQLARRVAGGAGDPWRSINDVVLPGDVRRPGEEATMPRGHYERRPRAAKEGTVDTVVAGSALNGAGAGGIAAIGPSPEQGQPLFEVDWFVGPAGKAASDITISRGVLHMAAHVHALLGRPTHVRVGLALLERRRGLVLMAAKAGDADAQAVKESAVTNHRRVAISRFLAKHGLPETTLRLEAEARGSLVMAKFPA